MGCGRGGGRAVLPFPFFSIVLTMHAGIMISFSPIYRYLLQPLCLQAPESRIKARSLAKILGDAGHVAASTVDLLREILSAKPKARMTMDGKYV